MHSKDAGGPAAGRHQDEPLSLIRALSLLFAPDLDDPLDDLLTLVGEGMGVSRAYLFQFRKSGRRMDNTHEWCAPGVKPEIDGLQDVSTEHFPWWMEQLRNGEGVVASSLDDLPRSADAERSILAAQGIQAVLVLPLRTDTDGLVGFMGFDDVTGPREWTDRERESLKLICQLGTRELERRRAIRGLRRVQKRLIRTERIARIGGWEFEPGTGATWWSEQAGALLGIPRNEESSTLFDFFQRIHPDDREWARETFLRILDDGEPFRFECRVLAEKGSTRKVEVQGAARERGGSPMIVGTLQDITERRLLEDQLRQAQRMDAVGKLAGGVAHDFNNVLSLILGSAGFLLEETSEDDPRRNDIFQILRAAERGSQLTQQLLAFSRKQLLEPRRVEVSEALRGLDDLLRRLLPEDVELRVDVGDDVGHIHADPAQLEQVMVNLIVNAREAMAEHGGTLRVFTKHRAISEELELGPGQRLAPGGYAVIGVEDDGRGMGPEVQARIFEPFFTTKPAGEGVGLGLSSAYGIVQQSGGGIQVESVVGKGSRFLVHLPAVTAALATDREDDGMVPDAPEGATILLVEDDVQLANLARRILERAGYAVISTHDPAHALRLTTAHPGSLDLLITDVVMPDIDGRKLARQVQRHRPGIRVLFISGHGPEVISRKGVVQPDDQFLAKPFNSEQLLAKVRRVLASAAPAS